MSAMLPDILTNIRSLIATPSVSCTDPRFDQSNRAVIDLLAEWLEAMGFSVTIQAVSPDKANLIATLGGNAESGEGLVLSGHTDTVPYDEGAWSLDPFGGVERDGRIYGLGSADMKSFFALAMEAARGFDRKSFQRPLTILATADEESTMSGIKYLVEHRIRPGRYAVIGEPTGLKPIRMHKGVMMERIRVHGQAGHSSDPELGASAIEGMHAIIAELQRWRSELQAKNRNPQFRVEVPTMNFGSIHGGDNPNRICARCELQIDIRPLPGMNLTDLRDALSSRLSQVLAEYPRLRLETSPLFDGVPAFETEAESVLVRNCEALSGSSAGAVAFGTEAPFLNQLGMETVVLGPGDIKQAHQPNEFLELAQIPSTIALLRQLIQKFCITT